MGTNIIRLCVTMVLLAMCICATGNVANSQTNTEIAQLQNDCQTWIGRKDCERLVEIYKKKANSKGISASQKDRYLAEQKKWAIEACYLKSAASCVVAAQIEGFKSVVGGNYYAKACYLSPVYCGGYAKNASLSKAEKAIYFERACSFSGRYCDEAAKKDFNFAFYQSNTKQAPSADPVRTGIAALHVGCTNQTIGGRSLRTKNNDYSSRMNICKTLGRIYSNGRAYSYYKYLHEGTKPDLKKAVEYFMKSCDMEVHMQIKGLYGAGCVMAYRVYAENNLPVKSEHIDPYLPKIKRECEEGEGLWSCYHLGLIWKHGYYQGKVDLSKARNAFQRSCQNGWDSACKALKDL